METNLLQETKEFMDKHHLGINDIIFIGSREGFGCTWEEFEVLANVDYHSGYGSQYVASDLEIHFKDGSFIFRVEYDGLEHWGLNRPFRLPSTITPIKRLLSKSFGWETISKMNE